MPGTPQDSELTAVLAVSVLGVAAVQRIKRYLGKIVALNRDLLFRTEKSQEKDLP